MSRRRRRSYWLPTLLVGVVLLLVGLWFGGHPSWLPGPVRSVFVSQDHSDALVNRVLGMIERDYYRKVPRSQLINRGLAGAVASLDDPYSHYYDPADYRAFQNETNPHLSGIGIDVRVESRGLLVQDVFNGSPAATAGLARGDLIVAVGSTSLANRSVWFSASLIKGPAGTKVTLTVLRGHRHRVVTIRRANLVVPVAAGRTIDYHGVKLGYVELTSFTQGSGDEVRQQVRTVLDRGARGLILDLRENGGGLLEEAVNTASIFIPDGTIVSTDGRAQPRQVYMAKGGAIPQSIPLVVLVDSNTASAAEIVTGALKDRGRATVVGTHTYGKGVFQEIQPLSNGGALDFTVGEYFTPNGQNLGGGGVHRGPGIQPQVYAFTKPNAKTDTALAVAEKTVAAKLK
ncbi:MAG: S41 family peptidase [Solirubrobacteraceae bacterium]